MKIYSICDKVAWVLLCILMCDCCITGAGRIAMFGPISFRMALVALTLIVSLPLLLKNIKKLLANPLIWALAVFVVWLAVSTVIGIVNNNNIAVMISDLKGFSYLSLFPVAICVLNSKERITILMKAIMYACGAMCVIVLIHYVSYVWFPPFFSWLYDFGLEAQISAFAPISKTLPRLFFKSSTYLLAGCAFATYFQATSNKIRWHYSAITGLSLFCLLMTYTRSLYLAAAVSVIVLIVGFMLYMHKTARKQFWSHIVLSIVCAFLVLSVLGIVTKTEFLGFAVRRSVISFGVDDLDSSAVDNLSDKFGESNEDRYELETLNSDKLRTRLRKDLLTKIKKSPIIGNGLGSAVKWRPYNEYFYLDLMAKTGICGLILYLLPAILMLWQLLSRKNESCEKKFLNSTWLCALLGFMTFSFFNPYMNASLGILYYCCVAGVCNFGEVKLYVFGVEMKNKIVSKKNISFSLYTVLTTVLLAMGHILTDVNRMVAGLVLIVIGIIFYLYIVFFVAEKNWLDIRAVFHGVWVVTIGLSAFRLMDYQEKWQAKSWYCVATAYFMFQIGAHLGIAAGKPLFERIQAFCKKCDFKKIDFKANENRYFWICITTTVIGFICFLINAVIKGYVPCFSDNPAAYVEFYTKFHIFAVAATGVSGFCYYCIVTQNLSKLKKVLLGICILYVTFLFPILVVSRGTFVVSALSLAVSVFYLHKKKFVVLVTCLAIIFGVYYGATLLRNYTDAQLEFFLEPSTIQIKPNDTSSKDKNSSEKTESNNDKDKDKDKDKVDEEYEQPQLEYDEDLSFKLPPKFAFIYSYLTVSHDNFNEAVQNTDEHTYGLHQLAPFNSVLRSDWVDKKLSEADYYLVRPHLNTINLIGFFYYDFNIFGVAFLMLLWSFVFGVMQKMIEFSKTPFILFAFGNSMVPVTLCFFSAWLSVFSQWMLWGVVLIFAVASTMRFKKASK